MQNNLNKSISRHAQYSFCCRATEYKCVHNNQNKLAYMYLLTPSGIEAKASITVRFLKSKMQQYALLQEEINALMQETKQQTAINQAEQAASPSKPTISSVAQQ